ncbi:MAG: hypothetical protein ABSB73_00410 [Solirubrobacteraceae bacterium]|jgi:hypothetical protein
MTTDRSKTIQISHRTFAVALLAAGTLGIAIGEVAAPLASSQAHAVARAAAVPAACDSFAKNVGTAFEVLGGILEDAAKYPPLIPKAEQAGEAKSSTQAAAIAAQVKTLNATIQAQANRFSALKGPILSEETKCLG